MVFSTFTELHNRKESTLEYFYRAPKTLIPISSQFPFTPVTSPPALGTSNPLSISMDLPILDISYKLDHVIYSLL